MTFEYTITEDDFVSAGLLANRIRTRFSRFSGYIFPAFGAIIIFAGIVGWFAQGSLQANWVSLMWGTLLLFTPLLGRYRYGRQFRKMPSLLERRTLEVDDKHLRFHTVSSEGRSPWSSYTKFGENDITFVVFQQGNLIFIPIPKRELSPSQIEDLRSILSTHLMRK